MWSTVIANPETKQKNQPNNSQIIQSIKQPINQPTNQLTNRPK
jgi:hypothetical protein